MKRKVLKVTVSEEEYELLEAIRNYNKSYPDGYPQLMWYAQELFDNMFANLIKVKKIPLKAGGIFIYKVMEDSKITDMKERCKDILMSVSWLDFSNRYFNRSSSWFYHKMDGIDGNGGKGGFTLEEKEQFRNSLLDLANRIRKTAEKI